jgi:DNA-binding beta-propeller fold protein YncE
MKKHFIKYIGLVFWFVGLWSCDEGFELQPIQPKEGKGVFIINEGNYMFANASLSYYNPSDSIIENKVFYRTNGFTLGDVAQSMYIYDSLGFIVVNNSARVDVINSYTFEYLGTIDGLSSPRYVYVLNEEKGYITDLYAKTIQVFNPQTLKVIKTISVDNHTDAFYQHSTEQMAVWNNKLFTNCWSFDNKVLVIDTQTDTWVDSLETGVQPVALQVDVNGKLWVLTDGGYNGNPFGYETPKLQRFDASTQQLELTWEFSLEMSPRAMALNGTKDTLFVLADDILKFPVTANSLPEQAFIAHENRLLYGLGVDPITSEVYVSDAIDYLQAGIVFRYSPQGKIAHSFKVGLVPGWFCFKP